MPHPTDIHVGRKLREARLAKSFSQDDLGQILGISFQQVQKYEKGTNRIGASRLWDIASTLDAPISFFFEGLEGNSPPSSNIDPNANPYEKGSAPNMSRLSRSIMQSAHRLDAIKDETIKTQLQNLIKACADV